MEMMWALTLDVSSCQPSCSSSILGTISVALQGCALCFINSCWLQGAHSPWLACEEGLGAHLCGRECCWETAGRQWCCQESVERAWLAGGYPRNSLKNTQRLFWLLETGVHVWSDCLMWLKAFKLSMQSQACGHSWLGKGKGTHKGVAVAGADQTQRIPDGGIWRNLWEQGEKCLSQGLFTRHTLASTASWIFQVPLSFCLGLLYEVIFILWAALGCNSL